MLGSFLEMAGFFGADIIRRGARRGLFKTMLKSGVIKGVSATEAKSALSKGGRSVLNELYRQNRKQVSQFVKSAGKGGRTFIKGSIPRSAGYTGIGSSSSVVQSTLNLTEDLAITASIKGLTSGVASYNLRSGIGGIVAGIGMFSIGSGLGSGASQMMSQVPLPSEEIQNANMFIMPRRAYTQRQRQLQAIQMTQLSVRSAFGQEAASQHR